MKLLFTLAACLFFAVSAYAQKVEEGAIRFKKEDRTGIIAGYDAEREYTEEALAARLKAAGLGKRHKDAGFWKYESVNWAEIAPATIDVFFDVERRKGLTEVRMMVSLGNGNFVTSVSDPQIIANMKAFLSGFNADVVAYAAKVAIDKQKEAADEAARDLARADKETDRAVRRHKRADRDKEKKQKELDDERKKLEELQKTAVPAGGN